MLNRLKRSKTYCEHPSCQYFVYYWWQMMQCFVCYYHLVHYRPNAFDHKVKIHLFNPPKYPDETKTLQSATVWINKLFLQFNTLLKIPDCCCTALISMCRCQQLRHHQWHHHTPTRRSDSSGTAPGERDKEPGAFTCSRNVPHWNLIERHGTGSNEVFSFFFFKS